jgi:mRNA-degrading endonuclease RelE of RelBE toxin-antitoxin system
MKSKGLRMEIKWSRNFEKGLKRLDKPVKEKVREKLKLFLENKKHPSLRYKKVQALKNETPPVYEISINMSIRITLQEFDDHIYLRNIGGHNILP